MLTSIARKLRSQNNYDNLIYLLVFLFPIFAISIRHWVSNIFVLLFLVSLYGCFSKKFNQYTLTKVEQRYIYIFLFYFLIFLLSSVVNGWSEVQTHELGTMIRFILIIPIFIVFKKLKYLLIMLTAGSVLACLVNILYLFQFSVPGVYGPLFSGPMILLFSLFIYFIIIDNNINKYIKISLLLLMFLCLLTIIELGARSAIFAVVAVSVLLVFLKLDGINRLYATLLIILLSFVLYFNNTSMRLQVDKIIYGLDVYTSRTQPAGTTQEYSDVQNNSRAFKNWWVTIKSIEDISARLEMWRAIKYFFITDPILGFGPGEYQYKIKELINNNQIYFVAYASHPHNAFLHELYSKGLLGLIAMLLVLYYPAYIFMLNKKQYPNKSLLGITVIFVFSIFSLTESATFNNNNFSSIMLIYISVILLSLFNHEEILC